MNSVKFISSKEFLLFLAAQRPMRCLGCLLHWRGRGRCLRLLTLGHRCDPVLVSAVGQPPSDAEGKANRRGAESTETGSEGV